MAAPIVYGQVEVASVNGKAKLFSHISPRVKLTVNRFEGNHELYVHLNSRQKSISLAFEEFQDLCDAKTILDEKLHFLEETQQGQQVGQLRGQHGGQNGGQHGGQNGGQPLQHLILSTQGQSQFPQGQLPQGQLQQAVIQQGHQAVIQQGKQAVIQQGQQAVIQQGQQATNQSTSPNDWEDSQYFI